MVFESIDVVTRIEYQVHWLIQPVEDIEREVRILHAPIGEDEEAHWFVQRPSPPKLYLLARLLNESTPVTSLSLTTLDNDPAVREAALEFTDRVVDTYDGDATLSTQRLAAERYFGADLTHSINS